MMHYAFLLGFMICLQGCAWNLKSPISNKLKGEWVGSLSPVKESSNLSDGYYFKIEKAPATDDPLLNGYINTEEPVLVEWSDVGSGDDDRRFQIFQDPELKPNMKVKIKGEALLGYIKSKNNSQKEILEFIIRVKNIKVINNN